MEAALCFPKLRCLKLFNTSLMGHSLTHSTKNLKMSQVTDFDEISAAYRAEHSEQNDTNLSKGGQVDPNV